MSTLRISIQQKILLLLLGLALPPLLLVGWLGLVALNQARNITIREGTISLERQAEVALVERATDKAERYDQALIGVQQQVETLAGYAEDLYAEPRQNVSPDRVWIAPLPSAALLDRYRDSVIFGQQMIPLLQAAVSANRLVSIGYVALNDSGVIAFDDPGVIDNLLEIQPFDPRERPWYQQARAAGSTIWTDAYVDANTGTLTTTCATPLYDQSGAFIGVLAFDLLLATIQDDLLTVNIGASGFAFLVNAEGRVIVRPDLRAADVRWNEPFRTESLSESPIQAIRSISDQMMRRENGIRLLDYNDQPSYIAYAPITTAGWSVALVIPASEIVAPAIATGEQIAASQDQLQLSLQFTLGSMVAAIGLLGLLLSLSFTRRIRAVQSGVQAVAGGDLSQRLPAAGRDEIGQLVDAFNGMSETLQAKVRELEQNAHQLATINSVSNELKRILDLPTLLQAIPDAVCERFGFDRAALYLVEGRQIKAVGASFGAGNTAQAKTFVEIVNSIPLRLDSATVEADVVRSGKAVIVDNPWENSRVDQRKQQAAGGDSYVSVPIFGRDGNVIGLIGADYAGSERVIVGEDASRLLTFANMVGLTIENVRIYQDLERQVAIRTEELRVALNLAQQADRRKSDFLASISHELRTPLNAIIGFSTVLLDDIDGPLSSAQYEDIQSINRNGRFLLHLIDELLDLARIEAGYLHLELQATELQPVIVDVLDTVQSLPDRQQVVLRYDLDATLAPVLADPSRVRQILLNLLSNAVKFTERGAITVRATRLDEVTADGRVQPFMAIAVSDTGVGIPIEQQAEIFEEFVQAHGRRSRIRGTGLGLAIVRKLVEAHHGRIWVESQLKAGSTFTFTLPIVSSVLNEQHGEHDSTEIPLTLEYKPETRL